MVYYEVYKVLLGLLHKVKRIRLVSLSKLDKIIDNEPFKNNYGISKFYDEYDTGIIRNCLVLDDKEKMMNKITNFYNYVMEISGGFDINKFVLRSEAK